MGPIGHTAIAFAAKRVAPRVPLLALIVATEILDLLTYVFLALGIESLGASRTDLASGVVMQVPASIPWSHGLLMALVWSSLAAVIGLLSFRDRRSAAIIGLLVLSHWILDFVVHPRELPLLLQGSPLLGLCLWCSGPGLIAAGILEFALFAFGLGLYLSYRKSQAGPQRA